MSRFLSWLGSVLSELRRRNVLHVAAVYAVAAWVVIQVAAIAFPALFFPRWALTVVIVAAILGFPVTLVLAWRYDLTSEGLRRAEPAGEEEAGDQPARRGVAILLLVIGVVATAGAGWTALRAWSAAREDGGAARGARHTEREQLDPHRIAVLPFADHSAAGELAGVASGLTGDLIHELERVEGLELVSYTGVQPFREPAVTLDSVARVLRSGTLVEGSIERTGDSLQLSVNLVDGNSDTRIGSVQITEQRDSLLALRSELVDRVARELRKTLGSRLELRALRAGTESDRAWEAFHQARESERYADTLALRGDTAAARRLYRRSDSLLAAAARLDRDWVDPTVHRAWIALEQAAVGARARTDRDTTWLRRAEVLATRALGEAPEHAGALEVRGVVRARAHDVAGFDAPWATLDSAESDLRRAVDQDPGRPRAWAELSQVLESRGRFAEARLAARRSQEADPFLANDVQFVYTSAAVALQLKDFETAERLARRGRELFPHELAYEVLHLTLLAGPEGPSPKPDTAWALLRRVEEAVGGEYPQARLLVAGALARAGLSDSARAVLRRGKEGAPDHPFTHYNGANVHLQLGQPDSAVALLGRYLEARPEERARVAQDWWFERLRERPDFRRLVAADSVARLSSGPP